MKKETVLFVVVALIAGLLLGVIITQGSKKSSRTAAAPSSAPLVSLQQNIKTLEGIVASDPGNRNAWVELGNNYFQSDQPVKAVEAYDKALELDPNDPNVITDQGTMFRRLGWHDRAIDNFVRANNINPLHPQSLFNQGVVYRYDLMDFAKAQEVWSRYLELHPNDPRAAQVRQELEFLRSHPPMPKQ